MRNLLFQLKNLLLAFNITWTNQLLADSHSVQGRVCLLEAVPGRNDQIVRDQSAAALEETLATYHQKRLLFSLRVTNFENDVKK